MMQDLRSEIAPAPPRSSAGSLTSGGTVTTELEQETASGGRLASVDMTCTEDVRCAEREIDTAILVRSMQRSWSEGAYHR